MEANKLDKEDFRFWLSVVVSLASGLAAIGSINAHLKAGNLSRPQSLYLNNWIKILSIFGLIALAFLVFYGLKVYTDKLKGASAEKVQDTSGN